ncbi:hypothetical protein VPH35_012844 [Triticum aestivum]
MGKKTAAKKPRGRKTAAEYHPNEDNTSEGESSDDSLVDETEALQSTPAASSNSKGCKKTSQKTSKKRSAAMPPGGVKPRPPKRVHADLPTNPRVTRSKKALLQDADAGDDPGHCDDDNWIANGADLIAHRDDENEMANEAGGPQSYEEPRERGPNLGKGLERITRRRQGKLPLVIPEGKLRPEAPLLAAKFATECNVTVRHHMPVFKRWKDYKDPDGHVRDGIFKNFVGKVGASTKSKPFSLKLLSTCQFFLLCQLCAIMILTHVFDPHQQRYRLKKEYFDPHPLHLVTRTSPVPSMTDEQWNELVESWKDPKKMGICETNKNNRAQVKFHQTTGSRSYPVHCDNLGDKYKDKEPTALDLFKEYHYSKKKKSYTGVVQAAITEMENKASQPTEDGQESNSATEAVAEVLAKQTKKPRFLQHVGIQHVHARSSDSNCQAELAKRGNVELRALVGTLTMQLKESEEARTRQHEEHMKRDEDNKKKQAEMDAKLDFLLSQLQARSAEGCKLNVTVLCDVVLLLCICAGSGDVSS